ncbi:MAG: hypothetical protein MJA29_06560, partial [Candidatus Omnitrophica bacterium]|nr:hypothetical protein [Candidatus Omnitrophota bacterium]
MNQKEKLEAHSLASSKDGDTDRGGVTHNRSLEALFQVTGSELQNIASKDTPAEVEPSNDSPVTSVPQSNASFVTQAVTAVEAVVEAATPSTSSEEVHV